jgi:hypothetical protein
MPTDATPNCRSTRRSAAMRRLRLSSPTASDPHNLVKSSCLVTRVPAREASSRKRANAKGSSDPEPFGPTRTLSFGLTVSSAMNIRSNPRPPHDLAPERLWKSHLLSVSYHHRVGNATGPVERARPLRRVPDDGTPPIDGSQTQAVDVGNGSKPAKRPQQKRPRFPGAFLV